MKKIIIIIIIILLAGCSSNEQKNNKEVNEPIHEKKEIYECYNEEILKEDKKSLTCIKKDGEKCAATPTKYVKKVARLGGTSAGIKKFNENLRKLYENYKLEDSLDKYVNYSCTKPDDNDVLDGVSIVYDYESFVLNQKYILLHITIVHEDLVSTKETISLDKVLVFDMENDTEITLKQLSANLLSENNFEVKSCDTSKGESCVYDNYIKMILG